MEGRKGNETGSNPKGRSSVDNGIRWNGCGSENRGRWQRWSGRRRTKRVRYVVKGAKRWSWEDAKEEFG